MGRTPGIFIVTFDLPQKQRINEVESVEAIGKLLEQAIRIAIARPIG
jgi:hypothetical protein